MKKGLIYFFVLTLTLSCSDDNTISIEKDKIASARLHFQDSDSFFRAIDQLNKMNSNDRKSWEPQHSIISLRKHLQKKMELGIELTDQENEYTNFPMSYLTVLNENGEVAVANQIWWYNEGKIHRVSGERELALVKSSTIESANIDEYFITSVPLEAQKISSGERVVISNTYANYQKEFPFCANNTLRKYVNELYVFSARSGANWATSLHIRIKLEWKGSSGWKTAGEYRFINYDLSGYASLITNPYTIKTNTGVWSSGGTLNQNFAEEIFIQSGAGGYNANFWYEVEMKGTIYQAISNLLPTGPGGVACNPYTVGGTPTSLIW